jgi:hypothetical protein
VWSLSVRQAVLAVLVAVFVYCTFQVLRTGVYAASGYVVPLPDSPGAYAWGKGTRR